VPSIVTTVSLLVPSRTAAAWPGHWVIVSEIRSVTLASSVPATSIVSPRFDWSIVYCSVAHGFAGSVQSLKASSPLLETYLGCPPAPAALPTVNPPSAQISTHTPSRRTPLWKPNPIPLGKLHH